MVRDAARNLDVIQAARGIVYYVQPRDYEGQARAIREWVHTHLIFSRDPKGVELLQQPLWMLQQISKRSQVSGDCDDAATLSGALLTAIGFTCWIEAVAFFSPRSPFQHVYTLAQVGTGADGKPAIMDMDTTRPARNLPPKVTRRITVRV